MTQPLAYRNAMQIALFLSDELKEQTIRNPHAAPHAGKPLFGIQRLSTRLDCRFHSFERTRKILRQESAEELRYAMQRVKHAKTLILRDRHGRERVRAAGQL